MVAQKKEIGAHKEQSLLFNLLKAFDNIEGSHKSDFFSNKTYYPSCVSQMF